MVEQFVKDTVGVVERVFQKPAKYVAGFFENVEDVKRTYEENKELKAKIDNYASLSVKVKQLEEDNNKLRQLTEKKSCRAIFLKFQLLLFLAIQINGTI